MCLSMAENSVSWDGGCRSTWNQALELHIGNCLFEMDDVPVSPVKEIEYDLQSIVQKYSKRFLWRHKNKLGWHHELLNSRSLVLKSKDLGVGLFFDGYQY